jgi:hypothetical protein
LSSSAERQDQPFKEVQLPVRGARAIDQESAALARVLVKYPHIRWLIVKGVASFADESVPETCREYSIRASALYALSMLQAYVTSERFLSQSMNTQRGVRHQQEVAVPIENVPFLTPPLPPYDLVGRTDLLQSLKQRLFAGARIVPTALTGLPGVGKTTLALALAHDPEVLSHFRDGVLWASTGREADELSLLTLWEMALGILPQRDEENPFSSLSLSRTTLDISNVAHR